jgi:hypothetical protein
LSKWRNLPVILMVIGAIGAGAGLAFGGVKQFAFSWLLAFMFSLSLCLGGWFLVMVHHLFDASWSVPRGACASIWPAWSLPDAHFVPAHCLDGQNDLSLDDGGNSLAML